MDNRAGCRCPPPSTPTSTPSDPGSHGKRGACRRHHRRHHRRHRLARLEPAPGPPWRRRPPPSPVAPPVPTGHRSTERAPLTTRPWSAAPGMSTQRPGRDSTPGDRRRPPCRVQSRSKHPRHHGRMARLVFATSRSPRLGLHLPRPLPEQPAVHRPWAGLRRAPVARVAHLCDHAGRRPRHRADAGGRDGRSRLLRGPRGGARSTSAHRTLGGQPRPRQQRRTIIVTVVRGHARWQPKPASGAPELSGTTGYPVSRPTSGSGSSTVFHVEHLAPRFALADQRSEQRALGRDPDASRVPVRAPLTLHQHLVMERLGDRLAPLEPQQAETLGRPAGCRISDGSV